MAQKLSRRDRFTEHPLARIGPGLITGVADDDPSGIATYSQAGAQFGFGMLWTMLLAFPLMSAVQLMCGTIGRVTGRGLAANIRALFPPAVLRLVVLGLLVANTLNIAADVAAMGEVAEMVTGISRYTMTAIFVFLTLALQIFVPYHRYVRFLKWLTLSLLAYVAVLFTVRIPWGEVLRSTVWPPVGLNSDTAAMVTAIMGTTISPYLFFWQASEEVEEMQKQPMDRPLKRDARSAPREMKRIAWDTWSGMFFSDATAFFIMLATAVTLHTAGRTHIDTAAQAASALKPLAGNFSYFLFAAGILGTGLIGVPVLAGSAGYGMAEAMGWKWGLERTATDARGFYGVIAFSVLASLAIQYSPITPMRALVWSAVINGVVAVPLLVVVILVASNRTLMGKFTAPRWAVAMGWITVVVMGAAAIRMFIG